MEAALRGAREIGFTVLAMSISLVAVFTPILLMGGIIGRLFREFAITLSVAILVSLVVSLTTTPMMCSRLLKHHREEDQGWFYRATGKVLDWMLRTYERSLAVVLRHPAITLTVLIITIAANVFLFIIVPKGFFPQQDTGIVQGFVQGAQDTSYQSMLGKLLQFVNIVKDDPAVATVAAFTGGNTGDRYRQHVHLPEAAEPAQGQCLRGHHPAAAQNGAGGRRDRVPAGRPGSAHRRPVEHRPVPIHHHQR